MKVILPELEIYQKDVLTYINDNPKDKTIVIKSPRQVGKSVLLETLLVYFSLKQGGSYSIAISPINQQSRKLFNDINNFAYKLIKSSNSQMLEIQFINGSIVKFGSAEQGDNLRGNTVKGTGIVIVDECAYIKEDFYWNVVVAFVNVSHNNIVVASTPKFTQGLFYNLYQQGMEGVDNIKTFDWTTYDLSKFLTPDLLDRYSKQMPRLAFQSEYLGQFISGSSMLFPDLRKCVGTPYLQSHLELVISIDWGAGVGGDDTALTVGQIFDGKIRVVDNITFNDKTPQQTVEFIKNLVSKYVLQGFKDIEIIVESNSIGNIYYELLMEKIDEYQELYNSGVSYNKEVEINILKFNTTNSSKKRIVEELITVFQNQQIEINDDAKLIGELTTYECEVKDNGTVTYNASSGYKDDMVMSLAFLVDYCWSYI